MTIRQNFSVQKNVGNFNDILNTFFSKKELTLFKYRPRFYKLNKAIQTNIKKLKFILSRQENIEGIAMYFCEWKFALLKKEVGNAVILLKEIHCYILLRYLEIKRKKQGLSMYAGSFSNVLTTAYMSILGRKAN